MRHVWPLINTLLRLFAGCVFMLWAVKVAERGGWFLLVAAGLALLGVSMFAITALLAYGRYHGWDTKGHSST
jgi:hypothetical protein